MQGAISILFEDFLNFFQIHFKKFKIYLCIFNEGLSIIKNHTIRANASA